MARPLSLRFSRRWKGVGEVLERGDEKCRVLVFWREVGWDGMDEVEVGEMGEVNNG